MNRKRWVAYLLAAVFCLLFVTPVLAEDQMEGDCGPRAYWRISGDTLTISGTGRMNDYYPVEDLQGSLLQSDIKKAPWADKMDRVTTIIIEDGITGIGNSAFFKCRAVTDVSIPESVKEIGEGAFEMCTSLRSIAIPQGVGKIQDSTFSGCSYLQNITIPEGVKEIGYFAFDGCTMLSSVFIPENVTKIGDRAFSQCSRLASIEVDEENSAYSSADGVLFNKAMTRLITCPGGFSGAYAVPDSVTEIADSAFGLCIRLTSVSLGNHVAEIGQYAFSGCTALTAIEVDGANTAYSSTDGVLFNKTMTRLIACPAGFTGAYAVPESITEIGAGAFNGCAGLTELAIPEGVRTIGDSAFANCSGLKEIVLPERVTELRGFTFGGCTALESVYLPKSVVTLGTDLFHRCNHLQDVYYGGSEQAWKQIRIVEFSGSSHSNTEGELTKAEIHFDAAPPARIVAGFFDVHTDDYYADAVRWAKETGITTGKTSTAFDPMGPVTRAEAVTFLWRASGCPAPASHTAGFLDVADDTVYYYSAVLWAAEQNVTNGVGGGAFDPDGTLTYEQILAFLCRAAGGDTTGDWSGKAQAWAQESGLIDGLTFSAGDGCPRADVVYCLWKQLA